MVAGAGETTCGNSRCPFHDSRLVEEHNPSLATLELPFSYAEDGENKLALVKVVLCDKCVKKLMYKRNKEKQELAASSSNDNDTVVKKESEQPALPKLPQEEANEKERYSRDEKRRASRPHLPTDRSRRPRSSRSRSPARERESGIQKRRSR